MKALAGICLALTAAAAHATTCVEVIPESAVRPDGTIDYDRMYREFIADHFQRSPIVIEARVTGVRLYKGHTVTDISATRYWKTDGKPMAHIFTVGRGSPCGPHIEVGKTYLMFAERSRNVLSYVKVSSTPLTLREAYLSNDGIREFVGSLTVFWVTPPTPSPN